MLVDWMNANEVNQAALSALVGVKQPSICRWMDGSVTPDFANCLALEIVTGIPAAIWLTPEERLRLAALRPYAVTVAA